METPYLNDKINELEIHLRNDELSSLGKENLTEFKKIKEQLALCSVMHWVACDKRLPDHEEIVIVYTYTGIDIFQFLDNQFYHYENGYVQNGVVTHWMPLPKPPCA